MFILGVILALVGWLALHSLIVTVIGIVLIVVGIGGNGYAHFGTPAGGRRRYWY